jgi:hypothetical protein
MPTDLQIELRYEAMVREILQFHVAVMAAGKGSGRRSSSFSANETM